MRRRRRTLAAWFIVLCASGPGCTLLVPSEDELVGPPVARAGSDGAPDGAPVTIDGALDGEPLDAGVEDGGVLDADAGTEPPLHAWRFDLGCEGWAAYLGTLSTEATLTRSAPGACKVCASSGHADDFGMFATIPASVPTDVPIVAEVHARAAPGVGTMSLRAVLYTSATDSASGTNEIGETYGLAAVKKKSPNGTTVYVKGSSSASAPCMIVDDVILRR